jgi:transposase
VQSLIVTCRLHGVDVYTYLVDVLQRVGQHPAARVAELTLALIAYGSARDAVTGEVRAPKHSIC